MLALSCFKARTAEAIKPRAIGILFMIESHLFTFNKSCSATESQQFDVIVAHEMIWRTLLLDQYIN